MAIAASTKAMEKIKLGIVGYGNLGRAVIDNLSAFPDMELVRVFSRRSLELDVPVSPLADLQNFAGKIDVLIMCGGSATDLGEQTPMAAKWFNVVDSFDTHALIPEHLKKVDAVAQASKKTAIISIGWDPGLFSMARGLFGAFLPSGNNYTFWGKGVSQGHSDALRRIKGVEKAVQYTIPKQEAVDAVRSGINPTLNARQKHLRECFVVASSSANKAEIENSIKTMPNYFADYDTVVHFISNEEFDRDHKKMPHGGSVITSGNTSINNNILELKITLDSNPHFTSSVLLAYARAAVKLNAKGDNGAKTIFDVPVSALYPDRDGLIKRLL